MARFQRNLILNATQVIEPEILSAMKVRLQIPGRTRLNVRYANQDSSYKNYDNQARWIKNYNKFY